jgi:hypothetical protein
MRKFFVLFALAGLTIPAPAHAGRLGDTLGAPIKTLFRKLAATKQDRVFHAEGVAYKATFIQDKVRTDAIVRISRGGAGKPGKPDILGLAIKTDGAKGDQDFLLVTSKSNRGLGARIPAFASWFGGKTFSSLTSFKLGDTKGAITTRLWDNFFTSLDVDASGAPHGIDGFTLTLRQGEGLFTGPRTVPIGRVMVDFDKPLSAEETKGLRFTPFHDGNGVAPVGLINWARKQAYVGSQEGRGL